MLTNLSLAGTLVNGHMVQQQHKVQHGDVVAIPLHGRVHEAPPIVQFRVECKGVSIAAPRCCEASVPHTAGAELVTKDLEPILETPPDTPVAHPVAHPVVQVQLDALPPPFSLHCIGSEWTLEAPFSKAEVAIGSQFQAEEFWSKLLPNPVQREQLAPCHFRISLNHRDEQSILLLQAIVATEVNGNAVEREVSLSHNDVVSIRPADAQAPLLSFRVNFTIS